MDSLTFVRRNQSYWIVSLLIFLMVYFNTGKPSLAVDSFDGPQGQLKVNWQEIKGEHFIILYSSSDDSTWAAEVLQKAEAYYTSINDRIGFTRYDHFWTWDKRTKIIVFPDQTAFLKESGLPEWTKAAAVRDRKLFETKVIVTFKQEENFLDKLLPHEICHLILRDFIGFDRDIPLWLDEGTAQMQEQGKAEEADRIMRGLVRQGRFVPLNDLFVMDIRRETDQLKVAMFYVQSISILSFLIEKYGSSNFGELCRGLRDGKNFQEALTAAYTNILVSISDLEEKWLKYNLN